MNNHFIQQNEKFDELAMEMRATSKCLSGLEYEARQLRLAMEADVKPDTKTCRCTEDAAANQAKHEDSSSAKRADDGPTSLTNFGKIAGPPLAPKNALVTPWSTKALKRQSRISYPKRCAR